jgi:predicted DCC family thiol-disulfide oxidoreductase YuxK
LDQWLKRKKTPFSYRFDSAVPPFDDSAPIIIFDGLCVLCSSGVGWMLARDRTGVSRFAVIQDAIPQAIYRHYGLDAAAFDTFMVLENGNAHIKWDGVLAAARTLPQPYRFLGVLGRIVPRALGDVVYDFVQRHRLSWFGSRTTCRKPTEQEKSRFLP